MTTERHAWAEMHPAKDRDRVAAEVCACGQELDTCRGHHCPRCGSSLTPRAA